MKILVIVLALFFIGCATKFDVPEMKNFNQVEFIIKDGKENYRLIVAHADESYRFMMFDALLSPVADYELKDNKFKSLKFLPPKSGLDGLFIGILQVLKADKSGAKIRSSGKIYEVQSVY